MITIVKHGDPERMLKIKTFECPFCGCVFKADKTSYDYYALQYDESYYRSTCPCCSNSVTVDA